MARSPAQVALDAYRRANHLCLDCGAALEHLIAWVKPRCPEHHEDALARSRKYNRTRKGKERSRAHMARRYVAQRAAQLCVDCPRPAAPGRCRCEEHLAAHQEWNAHYLDRKESHRAA
jgi:hypothetical protein